MSDISKFVNLDGLEPRNTDTKIKDRFVVKHDDITVQKDDILLQRISDIIYEKFSYIYCDNCRYNSEIRDSSCEDCYRKMMGWEVSKSLSNSLAKEILDRIKE